MMLKSKYIIAGIALILSASACKSTKQLTAPIPEAEVSSVMLKSEVFEQTNEHNLAYDNLSANFSIQLKLDDNSNSANGQLRILRDSLIWVSVNKLSIEFARVLITKDSVFILNRLDKTVLKRNIRFLNDYTGGLADFSSIQKILLGDNFIKYEKERFNIENDGKYFTIRQVPDPPIQALSMLIAIEIFKLKEIQIIDFQSRNLKIKYDNFTNIDGQMIPFEVNVESDNPEKVSIKINFNKLTFNQTQSFPFNTDGFKQK